MAGAVTKLKEQGWFITDDGAKKLIESENIDYKSILQFALNTDIREYGGGALNDLIKGLKTDSIAGGIVLQISKISNISAPKSNQESKSMQRLLKLELTDGNMTFPGLEYESIPAVSLSTPPGTKILLKNGPIKISNGFLLLSAKHIEILGGRVEHLIEKWEQLKITQRYSKSVVKPNTGAPSWSLFGKNLDKFVDDKSFKSLTPEQEKENAEFTEMRKNAINEAILLQKQNKKEFGGGKIRIIDHNLQKIVDKGYTVDQAKLALKLSRNNLERAFASLKKQNSRGSEVTSSSSAGRIGGAPGKFTREDRFSKRSMKNEEPVQESKPSGKLSLFDFLEKKLPPPSETTSSTTHSQPPASSSSYTKRYDTKPVISNASSSSSNKYNQNKPSYSTSSSYNSANQMSSGPPSKVTSSNRNREDSRNKDAAALDRSKFENNISASFRQKKEDPVPSYSSTHPPSSSHSNQNNYQRNDNRTNHYDNQNSSSRRPNFAINNKNNAAPNRGDYNSNTSNPTRTSINSNYQNNNVSSNLSNNKYQNDQRRTPISNNNQSGPPGSSRQPSSTMDRTNKNYDRGNQKPNSNQRPSSSQTPQSNVNAKTTPPPTQPPSTINSNISNIIDKTANINLNHNNQSKQEQKPKSPGINSNVNQHPASASANNNFTKVFPQMTNGYGYNPYKIVGFQNKESNEFAMNILKHEQNFESIQTPPQLQQHQQPAQQQVLISQQHQPPPSSQMQQQQSYHRPQAIITQQPPTFMWKIGDRCLAKYWEDGNFYIAEITAISDRTFVVNFLEYGNFEEIHKHDILPLTTSTEQFYPSNLINTQHAAANMHRQNQHQIQNNVNTRYREERPMYVPPAQRNK